MNVRLLLMVAASVALLWTGCKKDGGDESPAEQSAEDGNKPSPKGEEVGSTPGPGARDPLSLIAKAGKYLPAASDMLLVVDAKPMTEGLRDPTFGLLPGVDLDAYHADMAKMYMRFIGIDPMKTDFAVGFVSVASKAGGLLVFGDFGKVAIKGARTKTIGGVEALVLQDELYLADLGGVLLLADDAGFALATAKEDRLAGSEAMKKHEAAFKRTGAALLAASIVVSGKMEAALQEGPLAGSKIDQIFVGLGGDNGGLMAGVVADEAARKGLQGLIDGGLGMARSLLAGAESKIDTTDNMEIAMMGIVAKHFGKQVLALPQIENKDGAMTVNLAFGEASSGAVVTVGVISVLAVVAVPAFIKYTRRAKTVEAIDRLDMIYKSASNYYTTPMVARGTGMKLPCQFPGNAELTPDVRNQNCCGGKFDADKDDRCDVNTAQWATPVWSALNFQMNDQHYFGYSFKSSGTLSAAKFTASAHADLDCDGTLSTFERYGYGDETASHAECSMKGSSAFYKDKETE